MLFVTPSATITHETKEKGEGRSGAMGAKVFTPYSITPTSPKPRAKKRTNGSFPDDGINRPLDRRNCQRRRCGEMKIKILKDGRTKVCFRKKGVRLSRRGISLSRNERRGQGGLRKKICLGTRVTADTAERQKKPAHAGEGSGSSLFTKGLGERGTSRGRRLLTAKAK